MKHKITAFIYLLCTVLPLQAGAPSRAQTVVDELHKPVSKRVLVAAHRGDWRNWPENSLPAFDAAIKAGADIIELDLKMTKDSVLVICHDARVDRTTDGSGLVSEMTYDSIQTLNLRAGHGVKTSLKMPTLEQALTVCKDRAVVNIDKGYEYYDQALEVCNRLGVTGQVLIKGKAMPDKVKEKFAAHHGNMLYMPIIEILKPKGQKLYAAWRQSDMKPMAYEVNWTQWSPELKQTMNEMIESGAKLWVNSLWPSLNGGWDDDAAYAGNADEVYGKLLETGATIIQTDRIEFLVNYLKSKGLHD